MTCRRPPQRRGCSEFALVPYLLFTNCIASPNIHPASLPRTACNQQTATRTALASLQIYLTSHNEVTKVAVDFPTQQASSFRWFIRGRCGSSSNNIKKGTVQHDVCTASQLLLGVRDQPPWTRNPLRDRKNRCCRVRSLLEYQTFVLEYQTQQVRC